MKSESKAAPLLYDLLHKGHELSSVALLIGLCASKAVRHTEEEEEEEEEEQEQEEGEGEGEGEGEEEEGEGEETQTSKYLIHIFSLGNDAFGCE
jgi:hypothetical protein